MTCIKFCLLVECFTCNSSDYFEPKTGKISRSCTNLTLQIAVCVEECSSSPCHDEVIILSLPYDLSARRTCFSSPYMKIKENSRNGCCSNSLFSTEISLWLTGSNRDVRIEITCNVNHQS